MQSGVFDLLTPDTVIRSVESSMQLRLDGTMTRYPSYINRVFGVRSEDGDEFIAKFYRPGRWSIEAILEEHDFLLDCAAAEIPVVAPLAGAEGETLGEIEIVRDGGTPDAGRGRERETFPFAIFPKRGGRNFDAEGDEEWFRLGGLVGRIHAAGSRSEAPERTVCRPDLSTARDVEELLSGGHIHPDCRDDFEALCTDVLERTGGLFDGVRYQRVHGDCHRGNILDRPGEGLLVIDFDDMMTAPPVQDLWLLLPGYAPDCRRELTMLLDGYEQFAPFERETLRLIEPLRFMRMIYYLAWCARQRGDRGFQEAYPAWGSEAFWVKEIEDLSTQRQMIQRELEGEN